MATKKVTNTEARVVRAFVNALDNRVYQIGDVFAAPAEQVENMIRRGYCEPMEPAPEPEPEPEKAPEPEPEPAPEPEPEAEPAADSVTLDDIKPKRTRTRTRKTAAKAE